MNYILIGLVVLVVVDIALRTRVSLLSAINWRMVLARLPLPLLALAASYGVYQFALLFVPPWVAIVQASAFECTYIGLAVTQGLSADQRKRATAISIGAVVTSIVYNTLAGWFHRQPALLQDAPPVSWLAFAILHGAPLAWVAYLVADLLLHTPVVAATETPPQPAATTPQTEPRTVAVSAEKLAAYLPILAAFDRDPQARTADLAAAAGVSARTIESRRAELIKLGALHRTANGYARNGVEFRGE